MIKTVVTIFLVYLVYQIVRGFMTANKVVNNIKNAAEQQQRSYQQQQEPEEQSKKKPTDNIGEYVDYEEVDE